jgi:hypothetical protein
MVRGVGLEPTKAFATGGLYAVFILHFYQLFL